MALTNAISEPTVKVVDGADFHLLDLVLARLLVELLLQVVLGPADILQQLLQLEQLLLQHDSAGSRRRLQLIRCQRSQSVQLVRAAGS